MFSALAGIISIVVSSVALVTDFKDLIDSEVKPNDNIEIPDGNGDDGDVKGSGSDGENNSDSLSSSVTNQNNNLVHFASISFIQDQDQNNNSESSPNREVPNEHVRLLIYGIWLLLAIAFIASLIVHLVSDSDEKAKRAGKIYETISAFFIGVLSAVFGIQ